jgi:hypothetical protein
MLRKQIAGTNYVFLLILFLLSIPLIIYFYFLKWKTTAAYGDDLYLFKSYFDTHGFAQKVNLPVPFGKYRPLHGLGMAVIIELFQKNLNSYYLFNVGVQTVNGLLFAVVLNLFLRSPFVSLFVSLVVGVSRLFYFNIAQLLTGGALEGVAMAFFLAALYFLVKTYLSELTNQQKRTALIWSIVFANLSMFTHERYIVMLPVIIGVVFLSPTLRSVDKKSKIALAAIAGASILVNVLVKKEIYSLPFFIGTGGTNIKFSVSSCIGFLKDAVFSMFQINPGPEYLTGIPFSMLAALDKALVMLLAAGILTLFFLYLFPIRKLFTSGGKKDISLFLFLSVLCLFCLLPAVITIRLEPRWLEAPFSIFILLIVITVTNLYFKEERTRNYILVILTILFLWTNYKYFYRGAPNLSLSQGLDLASKFKTAMDQGIIKTNTGKVYLWETKKDENTENAIRWILADGYIFDFYQGKAKRIIFADSIYQRKYAFQVSSFIDFSRNTDQIVFIANKGVVDITENYFRDSLKSFSADRANQQLSAKRVQYDRPALLITVNDIDEFITRGFHEKENDIRWTNGKASIEFPGVYSIKDSLQMKLRTYMPPICKDIFPKVFITDSSKREFEPVWFKREGDNFLYGFHFAQPTQIQKISILSDTIHASPDLRTLSFPFISMELTKSGGLPVH